MLSLNDTYLNLFINLVITSKGKTKQIFKAISEVLHTAVKFWPIDILLLRDSDNYCGDSVDKTVSMSIVSTDQ